MAEHRELLQRAVLVHLEVLGLQIVDHSPLFIDDGGVKDHEVNVNIDGVFASLLLRRRSLWIGRLGSLGEKAVAESECHAKQG